jgi:hypothetical protein
LRTVFTGNQNTNRLPKVPNHGRLLKALMVLVPGSSAALKYATVSLIFFA